jgi:PST family polysaccharide transporter
LIEASSAQTLLLVIFLILTRLLTPADYGLMALATTVLSVPQFILSNGIIPVIIHRESLSDDDLSTAFWSSLGIGAALTVLVVLCAEPIAWLLRNPGLTPVLRWTAIPLVFMAIGNVPSALYQRRFQYGVFAIRSLVSFFFGGVVGIVMALHGAGVWSLVGNLVVQNVVSGTILWPGLGWYPRFLFNRASFIEMRDNIGHTVAGNFLASVTTRVDMLIIGAVDPALLGYYYFGQRLLLTISVGTYVPIGSILVPVLSRMRDDIVGLRDAFIFMTWTAQVLWMPIVAGLGATASIMVPNVFGGNWTAAVPLLQIISFTAVTACLYQFTYSVLLTTDRASLYPRLTMLQLIIVVVLLVPATHFGLAAIGWAYVAASLLTALTHLVVVRGALCMSLCELIIRLSSVVVATGAMVLIVLWLGHQMAGMSPWIILPGQIVLGALVYLGVLFLVARSDTNRLMTTVFDLARRS